MKSQHHKLVQAILAEFRKSPKRAERKVKDALKSHPEAPDILFAGGMVSLQLRKTQQARNFFVRAINTGHANVDSYINAAIADAELGKPDSASKTLQKGLEKFPDAPNLLETAVKLKIRFGEPQAGLDIALDALLRAPGNAKALGLAGLAHDRLGNLLPAIEYLEKSLETTSDPELQRHLSHAYAFTNQETLALETAHAAFAAAPEDPLNAFALAWRALENGDYSTSALHFEQSLRHDAIACDALRMLSVVSDDPSSLQINKKVQALFPRAKTSTDRGHLQMARYNEATRLSQADRLGFLVEANAQYARDRPYDYAEDVAYHDRLLNLFDDSKFVSAPVHGTNPKPIFILGMIRSGTTLLERLLSAAPQSASLGEVAAIGRFFNAHLTQANTGPIDLDALVKQYAQHQALVESAEVTLDKMPSNYMYLGWLKRAFPTCKILLMERDMRDVAASAFSNYFDSAPLNFTFTEDGLLQKFDLYTAHISAWERRGVDFMRVSYETLVTQPEETMNKITRYCGLRPFDRPDLTQKTGSIRTASFAQARQDINTSSIGRWRQFSDILPRVCNAHTNRKSAE